MESGDCSAWLRWKAACRSWLAHCANRVNVAQKSQHSVAETNRTARFLPRPALAQADYAPFRWSGWPPWPAIRIGSARCRQRWPTTGPWAIRLWAPRRATEAVPSRLEPREQWADDSWVRPRNRTKQEASGQPKPAARSRASRL